MLKHTVKSIASGEYSCSCGLTWDRDEGDECPANKELPGMWEPSDLSGGETDQSANPHVIQYADGIFVWFDEVGLPGGVETSAAAAHMALGRYARSLDAIPTGCTFCGSDEHMTAVCPMRMDERKAFEAATGSTDEYSEEFDRYVSERRQGQYEGWKLARGLGL